MLVQRAVAIAVGPAGLELVRRGAMSSEGSLARARQLGLAPATVIDVGAAFGDWSRMCAEHFPTSRYVLVEPLKEYEPFLERTIAALPDGSVVRAAAAEKTGTIALNVHADLLGTSRFSEGIAEVDGQVRTVRSTTLDELVWELPAQPPFLVKIDVQGSELLVLDGAAQVLQETALLVLEVSFLPFFVGGATFEQVVGRVRQAGFVVYDVTNPLYRPLDGALAQADVVFVPENSPLRREHAFATSGQRQVLEAAFRAKLEVRRKRLRK